MKNNITFFIALISLLSCSQSKQKNSEDATLPFYNEATFTAHWFAPNDKVLDSFHKISSFKLINQEGDIITEHDFKDKIYITDFFFSSCSGICPKMTSNMMKLQKVFLDDDEVLLLSHSVTPTQDSVATLKRYAENKGILSRKWHLVTGAREEIYNLGRKEYFIEEDLGIGKKDNEFLHTENFVLIDKNRHIRGIYNGLNKTAIQQLIADVKTLKKEK